MIKNRDKIQEAKVASAHVKLLNLLCFFKTEGFAYMLIEKLEPYDSLP